jgi:hypothetical protein
MGQQDKDNNRTYSSVLWSHRNPDSIRSKSGSTCMGLHEVCDICIQESIP